MSKKLASIVAAIGLTASSVATTAEPAEATSLQAWDCPRYRLCVWTGAGGTGARAVLAKGDANLGDGYGPTGMNNRISSYRNRTADHWYVYGLPYFEGRSGWAAPYSSGSLDGHPLNNRISSIKRLN